MHPALKTLVVALAAVAAAGASAQTRPAKPVESQLTAPGYGADLREVVAAKRDLVTRFVGNDPATLALRTDQWAGMFAALRADTRNEFLATVRAATTVGALADALGYELPMLVAMQANAAAGGRMAATPTGEPLLKFGSTQDELVFIPSAPCRVADTRGWSLGAVPVNTTRHVYVYSNTANPNYDWTEQGGTGTAGTGNCSATFSAGFDTNPPLAVLANVTAVLPGGIGNLRTWDGSGNVTTTSSINYIPGESIANSTIVPINRAGTYGDTTFPEDNTKRDIAVFSDNATVDVIVDVVGYYTRPTKSALDCVAVDSGSTQVSGTGPFSVSAPDCAAGYSLVGVRCRSIQNPSGLFLQSSGYGTGGGQNRCEWNTSGSISNTNLQVRSVCCRLP